MARSCIFLVRCLGILLVACQQDRPMGHLEVRGIGAVFEGNFVQNGRVCYSDSR